MIINANYTQLDVYHVGVILLHSNPNTGGTIDYNL